MTKTPDLSTLAPDSPFWAIGDVHGRDDLLGPLLEQLRPDGLPIVLLGDYINKGPDSAAVLRQLIALENDPQIIALRGNHEELFLRFLVRPIRQTRPFLRYGGSKTLESFGQTLPPDDAPPRAYVGLRDAIRAALPGLQGWLQARPYCWQSGNVAALHAGADPRLALDAQVPKTFAWGHPRFHDLPRADDKWVVHGHGVVSEVTITDRRIAIDTGAHNSGTLTAVKVANGAIETRT